MFFSLRRKNFETILKNEAVSVVVQNSNIVVYLNVGDIALNFRLSRRRAKQRQFT